MVRKIQKWGNSLGVRLPKAAALEAHVSVGSEVDVTVANGEIIIRPVRKPKYRLEDLLKGMTPENNHPEVDFGGPVGKEIW